MKDLALGIDVGTTSVKVILISRNGEMLFEAAKAHNLISSEPGFAEEDPNIWWESVKVILKEISDKKLDERIAAIGVTGMVPTLILVDEHLNPIRNSIQQNDARAAREIERLKTVINEDTYFAETANTINQQLIYPKFLWLKEHEPQNVALTRWIMGSLISPIWG
jgi:xylulokinase